MGRQESLQRLRLRETGCFSLREVCVFCSWTCNRKDFKRHCVWTFYVIKVSFRWSWWHFVYLPIYWIFCPSKAHHLNSFDILCKWHNFGVSCQILINKWVCPRDVWLVSYRKQWLEVGSALKSGTIKCLLMNQFIDNKVDTFSADQLIVPALIQILTNVFSNLIRFSFQQVTNN